MKLFDHILLKESKDSLRIIGLHQVGILVLAFNGSLIGAFIPIFSFLFYPINMLSYEFGLFVLICLILSLFSFGYVVTISNTTFKLYEFFFFIPILKIKCDLDNLTVQKHQFNQEIEHNHVFIECQDDPWADLGLSHWVSIKTRDNEYSVGSNNNFERIFNTIKEAKYRMKNN